MSGPRSPQGFTLIELLLAMSVGTLVLIAAVTALNFSTQADATMTQALEMRIGIDRTIQSVLDDSAYAQSLDTTADRLILENPDGSTVVYERTPSGDELHRVTGSSRATAEAAADALGLAIAMPVALTRRGLLRDADYRATAVIQGLDSVTWVILQDPGNSVNWGFKIEFNYTLDRVTYTSRGSGLLRNVVQAVHSSP